MKLEEKAQGYNEFYQMIESTRKSLKEQINVVIDGASRRMIPTHEEKNFIEREAAQQICNALENKVKNIMENEEKEVEKIYVDVEKLRNEFNEYTGHVNETLQSDSPDFTILKESLKYRFKGMHDHAYEVKAIPHTQELVKRKRVVHKHFGPDKTEYYDDVQDRIEAVYVDADRLEKDMFGIRDYILEKIDSIMENVDKEVESYKNWFSQELEKVSKIVDKTESELEVLTYQETNAIQQKKDHQKKLDEFNSIIDGINKILKN
jgi:hypothetical protein